MPTPFKVKLFFAAFQFQDYLGDHSLLSVGCLNCFSPLSHLCGSTVPSWHPMSAGYMVPGSGPEGQKMTLPANKQKVWVNFVIFLYACFVFLSIFSDEPKKKSQMMYWWRFHCWFNNGISTGMCTVWSSMVMASSLTFGGQKEKKLIREHKNPNVNYFLSECDRHLYQF